jgi:hypothetical protein
MNVGNESDEMKINIVTSNMPVCTLHLATKSCKHANEDVHQFNKTSKTENQRCASEAMLNCTP